MRVIGTRGERQGDGGERGDRRGDGGEGGTGRVMVGQAE